MAKWTKKELAFVKKNMNIKDKELVAKFITKFGEARSPGAISEAIYEARKVVEVEKPAPNKTKDIKTPKENKISKETQKILDILSAKPTSPEFDETAKMFKNKKDFFVKILEDIEKNKDPYLDMDKIKAKREIKKFSYDDLMSEIRKFGIKNKTKTKTAKRPKDTSDEPLKNETSGANSRFSFEDVFGSDDEIKNNEDKINSKVEEIMEDFTSLFQKASVKIEKEAKRFEDSLNDSKIEEKAKEAFTEVSKNIDSIFKTISEIDTKPFEEKMDKYYTHAEDLYKEYYPEASLKSKDENVNSYMEEKSNIEKFEIVIAQLKFENFIIGNLFEEKIKFISHQDNKVVWDSLANDKETKILIDNYPLILKIVKNIFGEEVVVSKVEEVKAETSLEGFKDTISTARKAGNKYIDIANYINHIATSDFTKKDIKAFCKKNNIHKI